MMRSTAPRARRWSVGALAKAAGVTVRTLHHYEQEGLLAPPARTEGGHRLYEVADVERLYRIRALCELGLSLDEARRALAGGADLAELLIVHLAGVEAEIARLSGLRDRLFSLTQAPAPVTAEGLLTTLDAMSRVERQVRRRQADPGAAAPRW
ncbi:MAG: nolA, partial [Caulobacteraceae bacterium]|nr:nolA [Caulobacteraceae bacterium]